MTYRKIALEMVVADEEAEMLIQAMDAAAEKISGQMTIITAEIKLVETENSENTEEAAPKA